MTVAKKSGSTSRGYRSALREQQAGRTRSAVMAAASACFGDNGYAATTMKDIAALAGVSVETVYAQGGKAALLLSAVDQVLVGDDRPDPAIDRAPIRAILTAPDARSAVDRLCSVIVANLPAVLPLMHAFHRAAGGDPDIAAAYETYEERRLADMTRIAQVLTPGLRPGVTTVEAADVLWTLLNPVGARGLVIERGWGVQRWADWVTDAIARVLLA